MPTRRALIAAAGASLGAAAAAGCGGGDDDDEQRAAADLEIVRYLLGVEEVEHAFWTEVASRDALAGTVDREIVDAVARNESEHVGVLERWVRRLGGDRASPPETALDAILAAGPGEVLGAGATLENLSAAAHLGQINRVQDRNLIAALLAIHTVEGRQAAALNRIAGRGFSLGTGQLSGALPDGSFAEPMEMAAVRAQLRRYTGGSS